MEKYIPLDIFPPLPSMLIDRLVIPATCVIHIAQVNINEPHTGL